MTPTPFADKGDVSERQVGSMSRREEYQQRAEALPAPIVEEQWL